MIYLFLAEGFEEIEALTPVDIIRRAGLDIQTVGVTGKVVTGSHGISVTADITIDEIKDDITAIVLPGGMPGTANLSKCEKLIEIIKDCYNKEILIAAICAAPSILGQLELLKNKTCTCFPGWEDKLIDAHYTGEKVEKCENIITARGAGVALDFALTIVAELKNEDESKSIRNNIQA